MFTDSMLESKKNIIELNNLTAQGVEILLNYIYTSKLYLNLSNIQNVLSAGNYIQLESVVEVCLNYLEKQLDIDNCIDILTISETYSSWHLKKKVYRFICGNLSTLFNKKMDEFQRITVTQLEYLLQCEYPVDCPEIIVLKFVLNWILHKNKNNCNNVSQEEQKKLLSLIRYHEIRNTDINKILDIITTNNKYLNISSLLMNFKCKMILSHDLNYKTGLVNYRGMELAIIKIGGFTMNGVTNEITYCYPYRSSSNSTSTTSSHLNRRIKDDYHQATNGTRTNLMPLEKSTWRHLSTIPHIKQSNFGTAVLNNKLYIIGGGYDISLEEYTHADGFRYCPITNEWSTISAMHKDRCRFVVVVVDNTIYAIGGGNESDEICTSGEKYNCETNKWEMIKKLGEYRIQHAGCSVDKNIYISGGIDEYYTVMNTFWVYRTEQNIYLNLPNMLRPRADHVMLKINSNTIWVCGGWYENNTQRILADSIDSYDINLKTWHTVSTIPSPRYHSGVCLLENKLYIIGGFISDDILRHTACNIDCLDIETRQWSKLKKYPKNIWEHTCTSLYIPKHRDDMEVIKDDIIF